MDNEPRWLDIDDELYPEIVMLKQIIFQNSANGDFIEFCAEVTYNSFKREIDLTSLIYKYFIDNGPRLQAQSMNYTEYQVSILDKVQDKLHFIGIFPNDSTYVLGQQFLSQQTLYIVVKCLASMQIHSSTSISVAKKSENSKQIKESQPNHQTKQSISECSYQQKDDEDEQQNSKAKPTKRKTVEQVLKMVAEWRKLIVIKKYISGQAADKIGVSKRSLQDYFTIIKLGQKYGFDFQGKMKCGFAELRNFVKDNHEVKTAPKIEILQKFKSNNKK